MLPNRNLVMSNGPRPHFRMRSRTWWEPRAASVFVWRRQYPLSKLHSCMNRVSPKTNCRSLQTSLPPGLGGSWPIVSFGGG